MSLNAYDSEKLLWCNSDVTVFRMVLKAIHTFTALFLALVCCFPCMSVSGHSKRCQGCSCFPLPFSLHSSSTSSFSSLPLSPPPRSPSFISRSRANSHHWWFLSFLQTRGRWRWLRPSRVSSCPLASTTSLAAVSNIHTHTHICE